MKKNTPLILTITIGAVSALSPLYFSIAEEEPTKPKENPKAEPALDLSQLPPQILSNPDPKVSKGTYLHLDKIAPPPAPTVPDGTKVTEDIKKAIQLIEGKLVAPVRMYSNQRVLMSRIRVRDEVQYHYALTDTSDSLISFDLYRTHLRGGWEKVASGVCHPGMESVKVAMPETGVMVDPIKHPEFTAALMLHKRMTEKAKG